MVVPKERKMSTERAVDRHRETIQITEGMRDIPHKMKFRVVMMTPAAAAGLLSYNHPKNRRPRAQRIATYTQDILNGDWQLTYEGVAVDEDGWLINGQNRLNAIIDADKSAPILLITGVPRKAMLAVDQGLMRNVSDVAKVTGVDHPAMGNWAACARSMMASTNTTSRARPSIQEVLTFIKNHEEAIAFAMECLPKNTRGIAQAPVRATVARAFYQPKTKHRRIKDFAGVLISGLVTHAKHDTAAVLLRNWLADSFSEGTRKRHHGMRPGQFVVYGKTQVALRAFIDEEELQQLKATTKEYFLLPEEREEESK